MRRDLGVLAAPRLIPLHLLGLVATCLAAWLGFWQLEAWQAQRAAEARDLSAMTPVALDTVLDPDEAFPAEAVGRPVRLAGSWLPDATFYVTGREDEGRDGVWAVTPVAVCQDPAACPTSPALLVVRGFSPDADSAPAPPEGRVDLNGWLQPAEGSGRPDPDPSDDVLPELRVADAIQRVDQDLYGAFLVADQADPATGLASLAPVTPESLPEPGSDSGLRNLLYAVEWWIFGVFALFVWWRWGRDELERARRSETPVTAGAPSRGADDG